MDIIKMENIAVIRTAKEFVCILDDNIHGPFPSTKVMYEALVYLFKNPGTEEAIERVVIANKNRVF